MFITFEGIEGSGKSTQAGLLYKVLKRNDIPSILTREPGGTRIGQQIRQILMATGNSELCGASELLLIQADRAQHVAEVLKPALKKGTLIICDRFTDATVAYQGHGRGLDLALIGRLNEYSSQGLRPDCTFLLDCPVEVGLRRALNRDKEAKRQTEGRFEQEKSEFHQRVRDGYLRLAAAESTRFVVLDGTKGKDELAQEILAFTEKLLGRHL